MDSSVFFQFTASARLRSVQVAARSLSVAGPVKPLQDGAASLSSRLKRSLEARSMAAPDVRMSC
ncbi:hypothetical protein DQ403_14250 [Stutzerimonas zhaodongensis]|uniref:Uncharacterized protein n=1 Tax=Stutzerimonas zhaodongensis TaxID=1176257 RepID=A0A365PSY7_9GAMM|nr:hypothetical protein DQ403_14250 [Stutzerimonas zhaodongensis]